MDQAKQQKDLSRSVDTPLAVPQQTNACAGKRPYHATQDVGDRKKLKKRMRRLSRAYDDFVGCASSMASESDASDRLHLLHANGYPPIIAGRPDLFDSHPRDPITSRMKRYSALKNRTHSWP